FTIVDTTDPEIIADASDSSVESDGNGNAAALNSWLESNGGATATDANGVTWSNDFDALSDLCGATGSATVTFTATDACGNTSTTTATFTIEDTTAPDLSIIAAPLDPVQVGYPIQLSATYEEVNPVTATWYFSSDGDFTDGDTAEFSYAANASGGTVSNT